MIWRVVLGNIATRVAAKTRATSERALTSVRDSIPDRAIAVLQESREDRITAVAAEVAFFWILSVVPWLIMLTATVSSLDSLLGVDVADDVKSFVVEWLSRTLSERAGGAVDAVRALFEEDRQGILTLSALFALWSSSRGFAAVIASLNVAYDVRETRSWFARRSRGVILAAGSIVIAAVLLVAFVAEPLLRDLNFLGVGDVIASGWLWLRWPVAILVLVAWTSVLYRVGPDRGMGWRETLPGAVAAAGSWIAASIGFRVYLTVAGSGNPIFGALGGSLILLVWLYLLALGLLAGGEINSFMVDPRQRSSR